MSGRPARSAALADQSTARSSSSRCAGPSDSSVIWLALSSGRSARSDDQVNPSIAATCSAPPTAPAQRCGARMAGMSVRTPDPNPGWLTDVELAETRRRLPLLYVEAVPVRVDGIGQVTEVGALLRANSVGEITRTLVTGRVMYGETLRDALVPSPREGPRADGVPPVAAQPGAVHRGRVLPAARASPPSPTSASTPSRWPTSFR